MWDKNVSIDRNKLWKSDTFDLKNNHRTRRCLLLVLDVCVFDDFGMDILICSS